MSTARSPHPPLAAALARAALAAALGYVALAAVVGCEAPRLRPWEGAEGPSPVLSAQPPRPSAAGAGGGAGADDPTAPGEAASAADLPAPPVRVGGPWVRCYGNFRLSGEPLKDMTRLSILCGPENGMRRLSKRALEGSVAEGQLPFVEKIQAVRGECYRVFAAADRGVTDLDVAVRSSRGVVIATDGGEDGWPIVQPDRPFCALEDDSLSVEISARKGAGRFAAEVWVLRTVKRDGGERGKPAGTVDGEP